VSFSITKFVILFGMTFEGRQKGGSICACRPQIPFQKEAVGACHSHSRWGHYRVMPRQLHLQFDADA
jgi:hypothetical protein